ncbi:MAG: thioredoxin family protein, partial [Actinomycetota bacterium]|nr:thioredoxin family protein [Actinomycetota bacterium]
LPSRPEDAGLAVEALYSQSGVRPGDQLALGIAVHGCVDPDRCAAIGPAHDVRFFPDAEQSLLLEPGEVHARSEHDFVVQLALEAEDDYAPSQGLRLTGVLRWHTEEGEAHALELDLPVPWQPADSEVSDLGPHWIAAAATPPDANAEGREKEETGWSGLAAAIALALVGGLILNLMPCVLPVLAIKVFSVAELAERDRAEVVRNGLAYTAGILASMGALAAVVLGLRAAGTAVGWGFQFQSPAFIAFVALVLVAFALNLFGTWEIRWTGGALADVGRESTGLERSFFEGLLAVVLSTPCSAPFLGTAVGFAFAGPAMGVVAIFMAIGLGLAAPFLIVTLVPGAAAFVPRSGAWMIQLRRALGFALLATVVWLLWIVGQTGGVGGMTALVATLLAFSFGLWVFGALQQTGHSALTGFAAMAVVAVALAGLNVIGFSPESRSAEGGAEAHTGKTEVDDGGWRAFDPGAIEAALAAGQPVFVAFSADWCITCKVNERMVLARDDVQSELDRHGFVRFKADWTERDEGIRLELARHGRAGVPMYLVYDPSAPDAPTVLSEILSTGDVVEALQAAAPREPTRASTEAADRTKRPS